jgi:hypothetical protein
MEYIMPYFKVKITEYFWRNCGKLRNSIIMLDGLQAENMEQ